MISWAWKVRVNGLTGLRDVGQTFTTPAGAYALAERELEHGASRVAILLRAPINRGSWAVADTRAHGEEWIVGLERNQETQRQAIEAGR